MKKSLFVLGVAVAAFASCTNEEVMEVASNRAIGFSVFVGNNTKAAVTEVSNETLNNFYVFGASKAAADANWAPSFNNDNVTANSGSFGSNATWTTPEVTAYWQVGEDHVFAAYADGNNGSLTTGTSDNNVSFDAESQKLTFTGYSASNSKDLIVAIPAKIEGSNVIAGYNTGVGLSFYHALSQVKFTFTTTDAEAYIPDSYIENVNEKIRIYRQIDSITNLDEQKSLVQMLTDRFGELPTPLKTLLEIVMLRRKCIALGFEKAIIKNGMFITHFVYKETSRYYDTDIFRSITQKIGTYPGDRFRIKQKEGKLLLSIRHVNNITEASAILDKLGEDIPEYKKLNI